MKRLISVLLTLVLILSLATVASAEDSKVLHWFISGEITTMDTTKVYDTLSGEAVFLFAEPLYRLDQNADPQPNLAVALPEISEDGTVYTITIRDDAKYANGESVKAEDVVYAVQRVFDPAVGSQNSSVTGIKNRLAVRAGELPVEELGVKAISDTVLEITLEAADPYFTKKLADTSYSPVPKAFAEEKGDGYALSADALLSAGPFILTGWTGDYDPTSYPNQFETSYEHNHAKWVSEELTGLINALNNEDGNDFAARWEHLRQANQYLIDNAVVIPLEQAVNGYLVNPGLTGYITHQLGYSVFDLSRASFAQ